jgi:lambda repressor-like predicted transcriptional regulator
VTIPADRYPLEPLAQAAGVTLGQIGSHQPGDHPTGMAALAERLDVSTTTLKRARRHGLTDIQADTWACALGLNPSAIWGDQWWSSAPAYLFGAAAANDAKETCPQGHLYDTIDITGSRRCSTCTAAASRRYRASRSWRTHT